jgi:hypothetical protein
MEGEVECPPPDEDKEERKGKRGPIKRSKARNLLERLWIAKFNASVALTPCLVQVEI